MYHPGRIRSSHRPTAYLSGICIYLGVFCVAMVCTAGSVMPVSAEKNQLAPEEIDAHLGSAITSYYDGNFIQAKQFLSSIEEVSKHGEVSLWLARCMQMLGKPEAAIDQYLRALTRPLKDVTSVRVELIELLLFERKNNLAKYQLSLLPADQLPPYLISDYFKLLKMAESGPASSDTYFYFEQGLHFSDNLLLSQDDEILTSPTGNVYFFDEDDLEMSGWSATTEIYATARLPTSTGSNVYLDTEGFLHYDAYFDKAELNSLEGGMQAGPVWLFKSYSLALPVGYAVQSFDGDLLYSTITIEPKVTVAVSDLLIISSRLQYEARDYFEDDQRDRDSDEFMVEIRPLWIIKPGHSSIAASIRGFLVEKDNDFLTYSGARLGITYYQRVSDKINSKLKYVFRQREYQLAYPGWSDDRQDHLNAIYLRLSYRITENTAAHADLSYKHNSSNTSIFDYQELAGGLSFSFEL